MPKITYERVFTSSSNWSKRAISLLATNRGSCWLPTGTPVGYQQSYFVRTYILKMLSHQGLYAPYCHGQSLPAIMASPRRACP